MYLWEEYPNIIKKHYGLSINVSERSLSANQFNYFETTMLDKPRLNYFSGILMSTYFNVCIDNFKLNASENISYLVIYIDIIKFNSFREKQRKF